ncbi:CMP-N-acetylneuraminate-poly-alpha-2,8-sialyltransferase-like isoform X1 [Branchiostoma floridae]|uniref:CMP-N-acetylneuraminate-poly-alpha-2, 8-sialyltransferase-like isoform X1 n=2 Tax=Branchiostoma floridae TaxID=7739 RepID=A0A9J7LJQ9_BRAFL|nr:CMP-N-acetylneuraminate-poly-alpha-2,8-sialyltransferase-like isoform X1 [Branchiostoma floridae]
MVDWKEFTVVVLCLILMTSYVVWDNKGAFEFPAMIPRVMNITRLTSSGINDTQSSENTQSSETSLKVGSSEERLMDSIMSHYNMTSVRELQHITRKYFSPKRHIIAMSDLDIFIEKCHTKSFTLRNSKKRCDVTHTPIKRYRTCALIGNGGILLDSGCGAEIDAHEFVIRNNLPPTLPYAKDVGKRTNLTTINRARLAQVARGLRRKKKKDTLARLGESPGMIFSYSLSLPGSPSKKKLEAIDKAIKENNIDAVTAFSHQSYMGNKGYDLYKELFHKRLRLPSTGMNTFALASTFCDRISLYGFYPLSTYKNKTVPYHYYDGKMYNKVHKMPVEFETFQQLHSKGTIRLVVGKCNVTLGEKL